MIAVTYSPRLARNVDCARYMIDLAAVAKAIGSHRHSDERVMAVVATTSYGNPS